MTSVGVIGLGIMGGAFARNLVEAGHVVRGYDPVGEKVAALVRAGGRGALSPGAAARDSEIVILSLPTPGALVSTVEDIALAEPGSTIVLECSTLEVSDKTAAAQALAAVGVTLLDCPISGTGSHAATKQLVVFASGDHAAYKAAERVITGFAESQHYVGAFGNGSRLKFVANTLVAIHILAAAEATLLAERAGLDLDMVHEILSGSPATSAMYTLRGRLMKDGTYDPALMALDMWQKDMGIIAAYAAEVGAELPLFAAAGPVFAKAAESFPKADTAAVLCTLRGEG